MAYYEVKPTPETLHGTYSREFPPILTIHSGDTVCFSTLDSRWHLEPPFGGAQPRTFHPRDPQRDAGHALIGPIAIRGAKPGMTLAVRVDDIRVGTWGWTTAGGSDWAVNRLLGLDDPPMAVLAWELDPDALIGRNSLGHEVKLRPFMGQMGMPPNEPGLHSTRPPRFCGGNLDCKELVVGSTLYLPIPVEGGLFSVGDGHALQADGEVAGVAIECPMERVELTFFLEPDLQLAMPRAHTPAGWVTMGLHEDLHEAMMLALDGMLDLMEELYGLKRKEALALASVVVDFRITQVVNGGVHGVHALLPHGALRRTTGVGTSEGRGG